MTRGKGDSLKRRAPKLKQRDRFLVYAEGDVSESIYLNGVRRDLGRSGPQVELGSTHGEPLGLVRAAVKHQARERREGDGFDQVWRVFDVESPTPQPPLNAPTRSQVGTTALRRCGNGTRGPWTSVQELFRTLRDACGG